MKPARSGHSPEPTLRRRNSNNNTACTTKMSNTLFQPRSLCVALLLIAGMVLFHSRTDRQGGWTEDIANHSSRISQTQKNDKSDSSIVTIQRMYPDLPSWMEKLPFYPTANDVPQSQRMCFVHIGKTAGSTLSCYLGFNYPACKNSQHTYTVLPGALPQITTNLMHNEFSNCQALDQFLVTVRDPLERMRSWFTYERYTTPNSTWYPLKKPLFLDCKVQSFDQLGHLLGEHGICSIRAFKAVTGAQPYARHNFFNYQYFWDFIQKDNPNPKLFVVRSEHLNDDWNSIERMLPGGVPALQNQTSHKNTSTKHKDDLQLSDRSLKHLCRALCHEIQRYRTFLKLAVNLDADAYKASMKELSNNCPKEARIKECPDRPTVPLN